MSIFNKYSIRQVGTVTSKYEKYMGIERSTFVLGEDGKLLKEWRKVKVPGHVEEVLEYVKGLE